MGNLPTKKADDFVVTPDNLKSVLDSMVVPEHRKSLTMENIDWLINNLKQFNRGHKHLGKVTELLQIVQKNVKKQTTHGTKLTATV